MKSPSQKESPPVKVGDRVSLRVDGLAAGGDFIGRVGPFAVFVSGSAPAEVAEVEITEVSKTYARGRLVSVEQPSPDRIQARCAHFGECGGCDLQHIYYPAQLAQKALLVRETLRRIGGISEAEVPPALGMEEPWEYRNKAEYFAGRDAEGRVFLGFLQRGSHQAVPISDCAVQHPLNEKVRRSVIELINLHAQGAEEKDSLVRVISRVSFAAERACVTLVTTGRHPFVETLADALMEKIPEVSGVCYSQTRSRRAVRHSPAEIVAGSPYLVERIKGWSFRISPDSFFQVNPRQTVVLTEVVGRFAGVGEEDILIEGYSGVGTLLIPLAAAARMATGIEESESALSDAKANIRRHHLGNARVYKGKVENILPRFAARKWHSGAVVLDPPRRGCGKAVVAAAVRLEPKALVFVSCDPATLARDLKFAASAGYATKVVQLVDMFPHTSHIEAVALCVPKNEKRKRINEIGRP